MPRCAYVPLRAANDLPLFVTAPRCVESLRVHDRPTSCGSGGMKMGGRSEKGGSKSSHTLGLPARGNSKKLKGSSRNGVRRWADTTPCPAATPLCDLVVILCNQLTNQVYMWRT
jgi:hypothetical protein